MHLGFFPRDSQLHQEVVITILYNKANFNVIPLYKFVVYEVVAVVFPK